MHPIKNPNQYIKYVCHVPLVANAITKDDKIQIIVPMKYFTDQHPHCNTLS